MGTSTCAQPLHLPANHPSAHQPRIHLHVELRIHLGLVAWASFRRRSASLSAETTDPGGCTVACTMLFHEDFEASKPFFFRCLDVGMLILHENVFVKNYILFLIVRLHLDFSLNLRSQTEVSSNPKVGNTGGFQQRENGNMDPKASKRKPSGFNHQMWCGARGEG